MYAKNQVSILNGKRDIWLQNLLWRTCGRADVRKKRLIEGAFRSLKTRTKADGYSPDKKRNVRDLKWVVKFKN